MAEAGRNWAGNLRYRAERIHHPTSLEQLQDLVASSRRIRALGTRHSFSDVADTDGDLVSVAALPPDVVLDAERRVASVAAGIRYGDLASYLGQRGYALENFGSLPHLSVAGACATGTHGSGNANRSLAAAVVALDVVGADGQLRRLVEDDGELAGSVVALGALGVVTRVGLRVVPAFEVRQYVYEDLPLRRFEEDADAVLGAAYSVSLFTRWRTEGFEQVWLKHRADAHSAAAGLGEPEWRGATLARRQRHPVPGMPPRNCTPQQGVPGPWYERLPHFRLSFTPSAGEELQSEYLLPRRHAADAVRAVHAVRDRVAPVLQVSEVRSVAADGLWLSPSHGRDSVAIHFTWVPDAAAVVPVVAEVERRLAPFAARPHWGKVFGTPPETVAGLYERHADFTRLVRQRDPDGTFRNRFVDRYFPDR